MEICPAYPSTTTRPRVAMPMPDARMSRFVLYRVVKSRGSTITSNTPSAMKMPVVRKLRCRAGARTAEEVFMVSTLMSCFLRYFFLRKFPGAG